MSLGDDDIASHLGRDKQTDKTVLPAVHRVRKAVSENRNDIVLLLMRLVAVTVAATEPTLSLLSLMSTATCRPCRFRLILRTACSKLKCNLCYQAAARAQDQALGRHCLT